MNIVWIATGVIVVLTAAYLLWAWFAGSIGSPLGNPLVLDIESDKVYCRHGDCSGEPRNNKINKKGFHPSCAQRALYSACVRIEAKRRARLAYERARDYHFHDMIRRRRMAKRYRPHIRGRRILSRIEKINRNQNGR